MLGVSVRPFVLLSGPGALVRRRVARCDSQYDTAEGRGQSAEGRGITVAPNGTVRATQSSADLIAGLTADSIRT